MAKRGIDIAKWNTIYNWETVKNQVDFAILKIINQQCKMDDKFQSHLAGCKSVGLPIYGVYNYSYATTVAKAQSDAKTVVKYLQENNLFTAVWLDIEDSCQKKLGKNLINIILAYKEVITKAGYPFGVYTGQSFYNSYMKPYQSYILDIPMWIARYYAGDTPFYATSPINESKKPAILNIVGWQYTSKGQIAGASSNIDMNEYYCEIANCFTDNNLTKIDLDSIYYPACHSSESSIIRGLAGVGEKDTSFSHRGKIAKVNGISLYAGTAKQNITLLNLLKQGKLIKA